MTIEFTKEENSNGTFAYEFLIDKTVVWSVAKSKVDYHFAWVVTQTDVDHRPGNRPHFGHSKTRDAAQKAANGWVTTLTKSGVAVDQPRIIEL